MFNWPTNQPTNQEKLIRRVCVWLYFHLHHKHTHTHTCMSHTATISRANNIQASLSLSTVLFLVFFSPCVCVCVIYVWWWSNVTRSISICDDTNICTVFAVVGLFHILSFFFFILHCIVHNLVAVRKRYIAWASERANECLFDLKYEMALEMGVCS